MLTSYFIYRHIPAEAQVLGDADKPLGLHELRGIEGHLCLIPLPLTKPGVLALEVLRLSLHRAAQHVLFKHLLLTAR